MQQAFQVADRIVVIRQGVVAGDVPARATTADAVVRLITGEAEPLRPFRTGGRRNRPHPSSNLTNGETTMRRELFKLLAGATFAATLAAPAFAQDKGTVYYLVPTLLDEFQTTSVTAIEKFMGDVGYKTVALNADNKTDVQQGQMNDVIALKPAAIVLAAVDFNALKPQIEAARAAGIPVMEFDRQITSTPSDLTSVAGTVEIGEVAAGEIERLLKEKNGAVKGKVLQVLGDPGDPYTLDIQKGFEAKMAAFPDVTIISRRRCSGRRRTPARSSPTSCSPTPTSTSSSSTPPTSRSRRSPRSRRRARSRARCSSSPRTARRSGLDLIRKGWEQVEVEQPLFAQAAALAMFTDKLVGSRR